MKIKRVGGGLSLRRESEESVGYGSDGGGVSW